MEGTDRPDGLPGAVPAALVIAALGGLALGGLFALRGREGLAFTSTAVAIMGLTGGAFAALFPRVMVSTVSSSDSLTLWNAASAHETLLVMTVVAAIFTPFVLAYQGWSYWVFRQRRGRPQPAPRLSDMAGGGGSPPADAHAKGRSLPDATPR
jgi:cytochrome d ubiquinol oxidase subunit II